MKPYTDIEQSRLSTMTQEEKAKRFDKAVKIIKDNLDALNEITETGAETVNIQAMKNCFYRAFPELRESEDERIRKALIDFFSRGAENGEQTNGVYDKDILAWLEKQGNEKPAIFAPKFREGDWIVQENIGVYKVIEICESWYEVVDGEDNHYSISFDNEYMCHLWDITKDAKEGDVLVSVKYKCPFIYKGCLDPNHPDSPVAYCGIDIEGYFCCGGDKFNHWWTDEEVQPATKELRDLLFQKMKEADYEFDFGKKEMKTIEQSRNN